MKRVLIILTGAALLVPALAFGQAPARLTVEPEPSFDEAAQSNHRHPGLPGCFHQSIEECYGIGPAGESAHHAEPWPQKTGMGEPLPDGRHEGKRGHGIAPTLRRLFEFRGAGHRSWHPVTKPPDFAIRRPEQTSEATSSR